MYLLGIDIGTTNWKVAAYTLAGKMAAQRSVAAILHDEGEGCATYDPDEVWATVARLLREVTREIGGGDRVMGLGISSVGEAGLFIDREGKWLCRAMAWFDARTRPQALWWEKNLGKPPIYQTTGFPLQHIGSLNKVMWIREHWPEIYERGDKWLHLNGFLAHRLTGVAAIDYSMGSRTMAMNLDTLDWSAELLSKAGIAPEKLPPIVSGCQVLGNVTRKAAEETGLSTRAIVVAGGYDHLCGAFGAGCFMSGSVLDSTGTSEVALVAFDQPVRNERLLNCAVATGAQTARNSYYLAGILPASGAVIEWLRELLSDTPSNGESTKIYHQMILEAQAVPMGSEGMLILPHLRGSVTPVEDACSRAAIVGARAYHKRGHLIRAAFESLSYDLRLNLEVIQEHASVKVTNMKVTGGGAKNEFWLQIKADITGLPIEIPACGDATTLGLAMLAGIGAGLYADETDVLHQVYQRRKVIEPNPETAKIYNQIYQELYKPLYSNFAQHYQRLSVLFPEGKQ